jgi:hypothetical protein
LLRITVSRYPEPNRYGRAFTKALRGGVAEASAPRVNSRRVKVLALALGSRLTPAYLAYPAGCPRATLAATHIRPLPRRMRCGDQQWRLRSRRDLLQARTMAPPNSRRNIMVCLDLWNGWHNTRAGDPVAGTVLSEWQRAGVKPCWNKLYSTAAALVAPVRRVRPEDSSPLIFRGATRLATRITGVCRPARPRVMPCRLTSSSAVAAACERSSPACVRLPRQRSNVWRTTALCTSCQRKTVGHLDVKRPRVVSPCRSLRAGRARQSGRSSRRSSGSRARCETRLRESCATERRSRQDVETSPTE